jgi:hypothetical protein
VGLVRSSDPENYAGGSVATGSHTCRTGQVVTQAKRDNLVVQVGGIGVGCQLHPRNKNPTVDVPNNERQKDTEKYGHL